MNYSDYVTALQVLLQMQDAPGQAKLAQILPQVIAYAELRIYRQFDFLATRTTDISQKTAAGSRGVTLPAQFIVVENVNLVTPALSNPTDSGALRVPLLRASRYFLDVIWPVETSTQAPAPWQTYWALFSEEEDNSESPYNLVNQILIAPTPDAAYTVEIAGTFRPAPLTSTNVNTVLTEFVPDLFVAASMVFCTGYQHNFGAQSDDPRMGQSWEQQYNTLSQGVNIEEWRKKSLSVGQSPFMPTPLASPSPPQQPAPPPATAG